MLIRDILSFQQREFDVLVIGGGITGACIAHDAALRGMKVALIEKRDFGWCTSSASSKLLHGGIRYLPLGQIGKVRESAKERNIFQHIAPHLTYYLPFVVPVFKGNFMQSALAIKIAMRLYDSACIGLKQTDDPGKRLPQSYFLKRDELIKLVPVMESLPNLSGGQVLYESHMCSSERMTLAFIKTAVTHGAVAANYVEMRSFIKKDDQIIGVNALDRMTGEHFSIHAEITVNAAGPYIPEINERKSGLNLNRQTTGFSKGIHLVTREVIDSVAVALPTSKKIEGIIHRGGRHIFILPWRDKSLIGTTNVPFSGNLDEVGVSHEEILDFLDDINQTLPAAQLRLQDVLYVFAGLYPLTAKEIRPDTYQGTGHYQVIDHDRDGTGGVITAMGAKYTTARKVAEIATDLLASKLEGSWRACATETTQLIGGEIPDWDAFVEDKSRMYKNRVEPELLNSLICHYGTEIDKAIDSPLNSSSVQRISQKALLDLLVTHAVQNEMACSLSDVVFRRTGLGTIGKPDKDTIEYIALHMGGLLGWNLAGIQSEIEEIEAAYRCLLP